MLCLLRNKKAQSTMEYAILIAVVIGVFSAMQLYMRRGLSARLKAGTDNIPGMVVGQTGGEVSDAFIGEATQYEPYYTARGSSDMTTATGEGTDSGTITQTGGIRTLTGATTSRTGDQTIVGHNYAD
ncbi:MAG: hypothetical protein NT066_05880 [Candidatus Omnitrophica bacterium]|nr:hypothetical protein [Candidatus Omnitrophota bacterium]